MTLVLRWTVVMLVVSLAGQARAQLCPVAKPVCSTLPNPVYILTADTQENLLKGLGKKLRQTGGPHRQMTLVYKNSSSCTNVSTIFAGTQVTSGDLNYIPADPAWDEKTACLCTVGAPTSYDLSSSAIFTESCGQTKPANVGQFRGPLQAYLFVVRKSSAETAITADEGYFVWGWGNAGQVAPWRNEVFMLKRPVDASTLICTAAAIGVPPNKMKGTEFTRSAELLTALTAPASPDDATIGLLGIAPYDKNRATVKALAFKAPEQLYAYYPDSKAQGVFDKINMREGRYVPWSVTDWLTPVDGGGNATNANAAYLINLILDKPVTAEVPAFDPLDVVMTAGLVPECAMKVTRSVEGGDLSSYDPPAPCGCAFDKKFATTTCTVCVDDTPCGTGKCRHGFCEAR